MESLKIVPKSRARRFASVPTRGPKPARRRCFYFQLHDLGMSSHQGLIECAISSWYDRFQGCTFRSVLVPVPESFLAWLLQDGVALEEASEAVSVSPGRSLRCKIPVLLPGPPLCRL